MKKILILISVLALIALVVGLARDSKPMVTILPSTPLLSPNNLCYYAQNKTASGLDDRSWIRLTIDGTAVTGEFRNYPAETDSKVGTFTGTVGSVSTDTRIANLVWDSTAEGMHEKEELLIKFTPQNAQPAFGDMVQGANGVYVYKDKGAAVYQSPIPIIDCASLDEIVAVDTYIRSADLQKLTNDNPVLGGSLFVTSIVVNPKTHSAAVSYEDGHIAGKGIVAYTYDLTTGKVTVLGFTKGK